MHLLLIHQNFPGQFRDLAPAWLNAGHRITAIGSTAKAPAGPQWEGLRFLRYEFEDEPSRLERGLAVAAICRDLINQDEGPNLVLCHSAWGEALLLADACGRVPWICYPELWGSARALGFGFDQGLDGLAPAPHTFSSENLVTELAILQSDAAVVPSRCQLLSFPPHIRKRLSLLPEGVDLTQTRPDPNAELLLPDLRLQLKAGQPLVTFISRDLEPLRGLRQLLQAWPDVCDAVPEARLLLVGGEGKGYGLEAPTGKSHLEDGLAELPEHVNRSRIHWLGHLAHGDMIKLLQCSACHLGLSYPYTLSWSVLEAMACGAPLISNHDSPIAVECGEASPRSIRLIPFNDARALSSTMIELLSNPTERGRLGAAARCWVERYCSLSRALESYQALFNRLGQQAVTNQVDLTKSQQNPCHH